MSPKADPEDASPEIWLVEDNAHFRAAMRAVFADSGRFRCTAEFADGEAALAALRAGSLPSLLLADIELPGMDGIALVEQLRTLAPSIPVVMLTVHQSNDRIFEAICAGASGYLLKSETSEGIVDAIERVLAGGAALDGQIARRMLDMFARFAAPQDPYRLSDRERQVLQHLVEGLTKEQIGARLFLSPHTIDRHVRNIYTKLHVHNRSGAVAKALRENLLGRREVPGPRP